MSVQTGMTVIGKNGKARGRFEYTLKIMCVADEDYPLNDGSEIENPRGVYVRVEYKNWITGNNAEYESAGLWGCNDPKEDYIRDIAVEQFETLQAEFGAILIPFSVTDLDTCKILYK